MNLCKIVPGVLGRATRQLKDVKGIQIGREEVKKGREENMIDDMIVYKREYKNSKLRIPQLISFYMHQVTPKLGET